MKGVSVKRGVGVTKGGDMNGNEYAGKGFDLSKLKQGPSYYQHLNHFGSNMSTFGSYTSSKSSK
ncbi:MAG: hypothetical protein GXO64_00230 [Candidatus Micrarchaeota archaeon]|nr:hypothetical protein [Candidatus Micrarchaeota archaeon]